MAAGGSAGARLCGFPPLTGVAPRVLVLGSMPGAASLARTEYYGHPRNAFWPIMGVLFGAGPELPYAERTARLTAAGVALWDVLAACRRRGSLDSAIEPASIEVNDIAGLLAAQPGIVHVCCNGTAAATLYRRHVLARLPRTLPWTRLPSTSPAHAERSFADKLAAWRMLAALLMPDAVDRSVDQAAGSAPPSAQEAGAGE